MRKGFTQMLHQIIRLFLGFRRVNSELHQKHQLTRVGGANHQRTEQSPILSQVIKFKPVFKRILTDVITYLIIDVIHQMTLCDVQNLVKGARDMEPHSIHHLIFHILLHLFLSQPALVTETKLQLVAVAIHLLAAQDRHELRQFNLPDARQIIKDLLLFSLQLLLILQALPLASATHTIVLAFRRGAQW